MANANLNEWDKERYLELNAYFRVRIQVLVDSDPYIKELIRKGEGMQLSDLINQLSDDDKALWDEFLHLDSIKLHRDMQNHLEGKGTPYNPRDGFSNEGPDDEDDDMPPIW
ncbi:MAG TPA: hypothetical protein VIG72_02545 [Pontibacter sp.]